MKVGVGVIVVPVPEAVPPHEPWNHFHTAPVPSVPPVTPRLVVKPEQIIEGAAVAEVAAVDIVFTITTTLTQLVVLQAPEAFTKYILVAAGIWKIVAPAPENPPLHAPEYQFHVAPVPRLPPVMLKVEEVPVHIDDGIAVANPAAEEREFTVTLVFTQVVVLQ